MERTAGRIWIAVAVAAAAVAGAAWLAIAQVPRGRAEALADEQGRMDLRLTGTALAVEEWARHVSGQARVVAEFPTVVALLQRTAEPVRTAHLARVLSGVRAASGLECVWVVAPDGSRLLESGTPPRDGSDIVGAARRVAATGTGTLALVGEGAERRVVAAAPVRTDVGGAVVGAVGVSCVPVRLDEIVSSYHGGWRGSTVRLFSADVAIAPPAADPRGAAEAAGDESLRSRRTVPGTAWQLVAEVPAAEVIAAADAARLRWSVVAGAGIAAAVAGSLAFSMWRSAAAARRHARELETVVDTVLAGVWISRDRECRSALGNRKACEILGFPPGSDLGLASAGTDRSPIVRMLRNGREIAPADLPPAVAVRTGKPVPVGELELHMRDGRVRYVLDSAAPVVGDDGSFSGVVGTLVDVTPLVEARRELEILRRAIDQSPASVVVTDAEGAIEFVNRRFTEVTGYELADVRGKNPRLLQSGQTPPAVYRELWESITGGREWRGNFVNRRKDGSLYSEAAVISPIHDAAGRITHFLAVKEDVTRRQATEAALATVQEELHQAQRMEAVGRLAGGVAHDFNNVLAVVMGYTEMTLESLPAADPRRAALVEVLSAARRAVSLTQRLLAFSRKQVVEPRVTGLNDLVAGTSKMLKRLIGEDIELRWSLDPDAGSVLVDAAQIEHVLVNLAVNARDAMPQGGKLMISTARADREPRSARAARPSATGWVRLSVTDTGCGIPGELHARVFEPFFTTKESGKGTGLGLSIVQGVVQQSGGVVWFESVPGRGTSFHVLLPRVEPSSDAETARVASSPVAPQPSRTILLVEDDAQVRRLTRALLESMGHRVIVGDGPRSAIEIADATTDRIDLLLSDVVMPGMSGPELAKRLVPRIAAGRVLFMSGYPDGELARTPLVEGQHRLLHKPFTREQLAAAIDASF